MQRARWRLTGTYRFTPRLQAGFEYNPAVEELNVIGNWTVVRETEREPMLNLGTSSDRIGTPPGNQSYYLTIAKGFPKYQLVPYLSINYSEFEDGINFPFGATYYIRPDLGLLFMSDGRRSHALLTYSKENWSVSAMWIWFRHPGISFSIGF